jgi:hypothetical protein
MLQKFSHFDIFLSQFTPLESLSIHAWRYAGMQRMVKLESLRWGLS